jgi:hypothetical protein
MRSSKDTGPKNGPTSKTLTYTNKICGLTRANGQTWVTRTITTFWSHIQVAWQLHNDALHAHNAKAEDIDLKKRTHFRIIRLHQRRKDTFPIHHEYFFENPDAILLATTLTFQRNWLDRRKIVGGASCRRRRQKDAAYRSR